MICYDLPLSRPALLLPKPNKRLLALYTKKKKEQAISYMVTFLFIINSQVHNLLKLKHLSPEAVFATMAKVTSLSERFFFHLQILEIYYFHDEMGSVILKIYLEICTQGN